MLAPNHRYNMTCLIPINSIPYDMTYFIPTDSNDKQLIPINSIPYDIAERHLIANTTQPIIYYAGDAARM